MCELFAMSSRQPTHVRASLEAFARQPLAEGELVVAQRGRIVARCGLPFLKEIHR